MRPFSEVISYKTRRTIEVSLFRKVLTIIYNMMSLKNNFLNHRYNTLFWLLECGCIRVYKKNYKLIIFNLISLFLYEMRMFEFINNIYSYKAIII